MKKHLYSKLKVLVLNGFTGKLSLFVLAVLFCFGNNLLAGIKPPTGYWKNHVNSSVVIASPTITVSTVRGFNSACIGMVSVSPNIQQFTVSGTALTVNITVAAPTSFEVSLTAGSGYGSNVTINQSGGVVNNTLVYVRSSASAPAGNIAGIVTLSTVGASSQSITVTATVNAIPWVSPVPNQTVNNGDSTTTINFRGPGSFNWVNNTPGIGLAASGSGNIPSFTAVNTSGSPVTATITVTPASASGSFAYLQSGPDILVYNTTTNTVVGKVAQIPGLAYPGLPSPDGKRAYVLTQSGVAVVDMVTNTVITNIPGFFIALAISPDGKILSVLNGGGSVSTINTITFMVTSTTNLSGQLPVNMAASPDGSLVYAISNGFPQRFYLDAVPTGYGSPSAQNLFNGLFFGLARAITVNPDGSSVYVSNQILGLGEFLNIISASGSTLIQLPSQVNGTGVSPDGSRVYAVTASDGIYVIDGHTNAVLGTLPGGGPIFFSADGSLLYTGNLVVNTASNAVVNTLPGSIISLSNSSTASCAGTPVSFTITVNPTTGNDSLKNLSISSGKLTPAFAPGKTNFTAIVTNATTSVTVTPTASDPAATITVNGAVTASGSASAGIPLLVGANTISIIVTAQGGAPTQTYTVIVTRRPSDYAFLANLQTSSGTLKPAFVFTTLSYAVRVGRTIRSITVTPTAGNAFETIDVDGTAVTSGTASSPIALNDGLNYITIIVTAQNGTNTRTYSLAVTKESGAMDSFYQPVSVTDPSNSEQLAIDGIKVHLGISPNGDGINDILVIDGIAAYPENKLLIMNSSGTLVFETQGYDNSTRVFDGHSNKNGSIQLQGTYFYSLEYMVGKDKKYNSGFFILKY
jgi:gliding motility-associated-like protein